ncbi:MAG: twin-arginine translocation signal domain-containing protein [Thermodesulfobacteriota bacterium]|nr:twin-arginine translocation signal domain-containing protein [Thermodesulfobacteriota bacterium]
MNSDKAKKIDRRHFLKKTGAVSIAAATLSAVSVARAGTENEEEIIKKYWQKKQKEYEAAEKKLRKAYKAFDAPPKYIYRGTDWTDDKATFYAPLQEECPYLPEFQSIYTEGTAGQYFKYTLKFGMKDIIRFHGHSCEALYYTPAICRLIIDKLFPNGVVDRTLLRGMGGKSP